MDYLVYDNVVAAQADAKLIFQRGAAIATQRGFEVDASGITGKRDGQDAADAEKTTAWDVPRQRLDGKWVVLHPKHHPMAQTELAPGTTYLAYAMHGITASEDAEAPTWWPADE